MRGFFVYVYLALRLPAHWLPESKPHYQKSSPAFLLFFFFAEPRPLGNSHCLRSYFYLRGELECCQIVILLLCCVFIHSIWIRSSPWPSPFTPFSAQLCACVNPQLSPSSVWLAGCVFCVCFLFCHAPFSRVRTEQMFYLNAHYYYSISTAESEAGTHAKGGGCRTSCAHHTKLSKMILDIQKFANNFL